MGRTVAVVLFTDLVGSTELRGRLGEDAAEDLRRKHDQLLAQAVDANAGRVVKGLGDGIMATFTGASDAVAAAVAIQQAVDRLNRTGKAAVPLAVRVGVSAGDVVFEQDDLHGTPVVEAARLCAAAVGGEILVSEVVRWLGGSQGAESFTPVGSLELKGLAAPVPALRVEWQPARAPTIPMPALLTDIGRIFVGRDGELERLGRLWKEATAGERRVALLAGEPGVGKTRLAAELALKVHEEEGVVLAGRCDEDLGVPYQPFVEALRHFVDHTPLPELKDRLGRYGGELTRLVPELAESVGGLAPPLQSDSETERYRLFDAVAAWLAAASSDEPLLLVLDDLQWAAKPTLLLLRHVLRIPDVPLLVLGTYRDTELSHNQPLIELIGDLHRHSGFARLSLSGLDDRAVTAIVERVAGATLDGYGVVLARAIHEETEGNPFFIREVLRHLVESGVVQHHEGAWTARLPVEDLGIPDGVRDVVGRRLARLDETTAQLLRVAAVAGAEFELAVVKEAGSFEDDALIGAVEEAAGARLIIEASPGRYRFGHTLVRGTLYDELTAARRVVLHRRVADAIEVVHGGALDDHLPALAHHWARACQSAAEVPRAVEYACRAASRALDQLAHDEAVAFYRQALDLLVLAPDDDARRLELLIAMGEAQRRAGDAGHRETLLEAARLAGDLGDADACAQAALVNRRGPYSRWEPVDVERVAILEQALRALGPAKTRTRARLLASLARELYFAADDRRYGLAAEALTIAREVAEPAILAEVLDAVWYAAWEPAGLERRSALVDELAGLSRTLGDHLLEFHAGIALFLTAMQQGDLMRADAGLAVSARIADDLGQPLLRWQVLYTRAHREMVEGHLDAAEELVDEARRFGESVGQPSVVYHQGGLALLRFLQRDFGGAIPLLERFAASVLPFRAALAWAYAETGRAAEARALLESLTPGGFRNIPRDHAWLGTLAFSARACAVLRECDAAAQLYQLLGDHEDEMVVFPVGWAGPVAHDLGLLAATVGRCAEALSHFGRAHSLEQRMGAQAMLPTTQTEWACVLLGRGRVGDAERARELLGEALSTAKTLGLVNVERRAIAVLQDSS